MLAPCASDSAHDCGSARQLTVCTLRSRCHCTARMRAEIICAARTQALARARDVNIIYYGYAPLLAARAFMAKDALPQMIQ
eukprot:1517841-Alexandrium_andersonii.AAC.1